jgi:prepilin-type N-terminal cleavage/methylation domain-containing protein
MKRMLQKINRQRGMTYVELIVVLSIFSMISAVVIYNYGAFEGKVEVKSLAHDIALKIVEAQKSSTGGKLPLAAVPANWKPAYGVYFDITTPKQFIYYADINNSKTYDEPPIETISITKGDYISRIVSYSSRRTTVITTPLYISFQRPDSSAIFTSTNGVELTGFEYIQLTVQSPRSQTALIKIFPSGRIQVN